MRVRVQSPNMGVEVGDAIFGPCVEDHIGYVADLQVHTHRDMDLIVEIRPEWEKYVKGNWLAEDYEESGDDLLCGKVISRTTLIFRPD